VAGDIPANRNRSARPMTAGIPKAKAALEATEDSGGVLLSSPYATLSKKRVIKAPIASPAYQHKNPKR
jgi:hypothetical protein